MISLICSTFCSLENFAFLYGTFPTASGVFSYAADYHIALNIIGTYISSVGSSPTEQTIRQRSTSQEYIYIISAGSSPKQQTIRQRSTLQVQIYHQGGLLLRGRLSDSTQHHRYIYIISGVFSYAADYQIVLNIIGTQSHYKNSQKKLYFSSF